MNSFEYTYPVLGTDVDSRHIAAFDILGKDM